MASKTFVRTLRAASKTKAPTQPLQKRTFTSALAVRPAVAAVNGRSAAQSPVQQQSRGVKTIDFAGTKEKVYGMLPGHCE
jgi:ketol-acid reductoisomerase